MWLERKQTGLLVEPSISTVCVLSSEKIRSVKASIDSAMVIYVERRGSEWIVPISDKRFLLIWSILEENWDRSCGFSLKWSKSIGLK